MKKLSLTFSACVALLAIAMLGWAADPSSSSSVDQPKKENIIKRAWHGTEHAGQKVWGGTQRTGQRVWGAARGGGETTSYLSTSISLPPGIEQKEVRSGEAISDVLRVATESALTQGGFDNLVDQFVEGDRHRINQSLNGLSNKSQLNDSWNKACDQFKAQWKSKFGHDFDIKKGDEPYAQNLYLTEGTITDPNQLTNWPLSQMSSMSSSMSSSEQRSSSRMGSSSTTYGAGASSEKEGAIAAGKEAVREGVAAGTESARESMGYPREGTGAKYDTPKEANLEKGREVAVAVFPSRGGAQELTISFIHEKPDFWKIDVPNNIDGAMLYSNLTQHITDLTTNFSSMPADEQQARLFVTYHVLQAVYGIPSSKGMGWGASSSSFGSSSGSMSSPSGSSSSYGTEGSSSSSMSGSSSGMGSQSGTQGRTSGGTQGQSTEGSKSSSGY